MGAVARLRGWLCRAFKAPVDRARRRLEAQVGDTLQPFDLALGGALFAVGTVEAAVAGRGLFSGTVGAVAVHVLLGLQTLPLTMRRRRPIMTMAVIGTSGTLQPDGAAAVDLARRERPDVVLMDVRMPHLDGIEATRRITALAGGDAVRVVMLTTFDLDQYVFSVVRAGAAGFLLKDVTPEDLVRAVRVVADGGALLAPSVTRHLLEEFARTPAPGGAASDAVASLTDREREVLGLLAQGLSNAEIAAELVVAETTVKTHVSRILSKLDVRDRVQAVVFAHDAGVVRAGSR